VVYQPLMIALLRHMDFRPWIVLLILFHTSIQSKVWSQNFTQTVRGDVVDADTKTKLPGVRIVVVGSEPIIGAVSDANGFFQIQHVPVGRVNFRVSLLGYEELLLNQVQVASGKELILNLELKEKIGELKEVVITSDTDKGKPVNEMATVSVRTFNVEETQRYAASFNDPARMAVSFAGVSTSDDASNEIIVRGNSARGMLWRIEGVEIPSPNHFSNGEGGSGGGISILSAQVLGTSDFYTGAFPAEYGNALSGVFDIRFRKGNFAKREYSLQLGILGLQASLEGPFSKKYNGSYLINYRYSTLVMLNAIGLPVVDNALVPQFQDISYHIHLPTKKTGNFSIWGLGGLSSAGDIAVKDSSRWERRSDRFEDHNEQRVGATGLSHLFLLKNRKTYLKTVVAVSGDLLGYRLDSLDQNYQAKTAYEDRFVYYNTRANVFLNHKFNAKHMLRVGAIYSTYFFNLKSSGLDLSSGTTGIFVNENGNTGLQQAYAQWKFRVSDKIDLNTGVHQSFFLLNNKVVVEPRLGLQWRVALRHLINVGAGLHSRIEPVSVYMTRVWNEFGVSQPNRNLDITKSFHSVAGYEWRLAEQVKLKSEVYYQYLYDVPVDTASGADISVLNFSAGLSRTSFVNEGTGRNYGLEITIEKTFTKNYFFLFTGSLFQSEYTIGDGVWHSTRFNGNYMLNALGGYEFEFGRKKQSRWGLNARLIWRGGNRYTPIDLEASLQQGREVLQQTAPFSQKVPDYFRVDVSTNLRFNFANWAFSISVEIQNATNRLNINRYIFDPYTDEIRALKMFGIMPVFNFKFEF
jgi:hypothetical protein